MKTKRLLWVFLALLIVSALALTACGGAEEPTEPPAEEEVMEAEPVTLRVFAGNVGNELELTKAAADRYMEANPNVTVEVVDTPDFVEDRLGVYLQLFEAQSPEGDVFQIDVIWPGDLATHFVDLNEYGAADVADDHFPAIVENNTVDGKLVGIPWFTDAGLLYYRSDLLEKYGYDAPPATWDELEEMADTIQAGERDAGNADFWGFVWQGNAYEGLTCDALEWVYSNGGGTIVSPDKVITINNPAAIAAVERAADWVGTISPPGVTGFGEEEARGVWQAGNAAFMRNWPYAYSLGQAEDSAILDKFDVSPLPAGASGRAATLGGWQLAVSKYSENPEAAADLALFMASYDEQKARAINGSFNPTIKSLYEDADVLEATPFFGSLYDVFINAVARPSTATAPNYAETSRIFFSAVHDVLTGANDAASAFEAMELDLVDLLNFEIGEPMGMPEMEEMGEPFKAGMVTDVGGVDDKSFNAVSWAGLQMAEADLDNVEVQVLESQQQTDYAVNINQLLEQEVDLIVTVGFLLGEDTATFAADNPETLFAIVDFGYAEPTDNLKGLGFSTDEAAFLAGYVAAGMTETGKVGMFGGIEIPTVTIFMDGYAAGVAYYNEVNGTSVEALGRNLFVGNFDSTEDGRNTGQTLIDEGADIIMPVAGPVGLGTAAVAQENEGVKVVWVDTDGCVSAPEYCDVFLTSVQKKIDNAVFAVTEAAQAGDTAGWSTPYDGTLANDGVDLAPFNQFEDDVPDDLKAKVDELKQMIIDGELDITAYYPAQ